MWVMWVMWIMWVMYVVGHDSHVGHSTVGNYPQREGIVTYLYRRVAILMKLYQRSVGGTRIISR